MSRSWLACIALVTTMPTAAAPAGKIPISSFAEPPLVEAARLSPDGTRIAAIESGKDSDYVFIISPDAPTKVLRRMDIGKFAIDEVVWANDDRLILPLYREVNLFGFQIRAMRFRVVEITSGEVRRLDDQVKDFAVNEVLRVERGGRTVLVSGVEPNDRWPSVKRLDLVTGQLAAVQDSVRGVNSWFVDEQGLVRGGLSREGYRWTLYYRTRSGEPLQTVKGKFDTRDEDVFDSVYFSPLAGESFVVSNHVAGRFAAYRLNLSTVEPGTLVFANPNGDIDSLLHDPESGRMVGVRYHDGRWRTHFVDKELAQIQARIDRALPRTDNLLVNWSNGRRKVLIRSAQADEPGIFYLLDRASGEMKIITAQYPSIPLEALSPTRLVSFKARDGLIIPAYLTLPKGRLERGLPLVLMPHGGPFARDTSDYDPWLQMMVNRGYAVLQPQFRGTTGFGRDFVERGFGQWGRKMQDDLDDGLDWLVGQGIIDPKRVCIAGASYGGYAAIWGAIRTPERYRCAISWAGVTDLKMMLKYDQKLFAAPRYYRDWRNQVTGLDTRNDLDSVSPLKQAGRLRAPLLLGHGKLDDNVPIGQAEALEKAFVKAGIRIEKVHYEKAGHSMQSSGDLADWLSRVEAFLIRHNPADPPSSG